ncbi:hypothetical protein C3L33_14930, partial [Rhododendron williamsianum]
MPFLIPAAAASLLESAVSTHSPTPRPLHPAQILTSSTCTPNSTYPTQPTSSSDSPRLAPSSPGPPSSPAPSVTATSPSPYPTSPACAAMAAVDMYCKTGLRDDVCKVFDGMPLRNLVTWNAFSAKWWRGDAITFCAFLNACSDAEDLKLGRQLHGFVIRYGYEADVLVANGLVDFYGKCHEMGCFEVVFGGMSSRYDVSWSSMVAAYEQNDEQEKACLVFVKARTEGIEPTDYMVSAGIDLGRLVHALAAKACLEKNVFVGSALVDMYGKCGSNRGLAGEVKMGMEIFESMRGRYGIELGIEHYACVVDMLARAGKGEEAYEFIRKLGRVAAENLFELDPHDSGKHVLLLSMFAASGSFWQLLAGSFVSQAYLEFINYFALAVPFYFHLLFSLPENVHTSS